MKNSVNRWLKAGYFIMAFEGPSAISVERLAREVKLNKSGFYHHFGGRDVFLSLLMEYHIKENNKVTPDFSKAKNFDPDILRIYIKYRTTLMMQMQLRKHSDVPIFNEAFLKVSQKNAKYQLPLWAEYLNIPGKHSLAADLFDICRDVLYIRITTPDKFEPELYRVTQIFSRIASAFTKHGYNLAEVSKELISHLK